MGSVQMDSDIPLVVDEPEDDLLNPEQSHRLKTLFDLQDQCPLTDAQQGELSAVVGEQVHCPLYPLTQSRSSNRLCHAG